MPQEPVKPDWEEQGGGQGPRGVGRRGWKGLGTAAEHGCPSGEQGAAGFWGWGRAERSGEKGEAEGDELWKGWSRRAGVSVVDQPTCGELGWVLRVAGFSWMLRW